MKLLKVMASAALVLSLAAAASADKAKIVMEGSTTVLPIAQAAAEAYMDKNADVNITVRGGGSGVGISSLIDSTCDIGDSSRPIKASEIASALGKGVDPKANVIAMDGICVIVNPANGVSALSKKQVKQIFTGEINDWAQVGGQGGKIVVVSRDTSSGTYEAFGTLALEGAKVRPDALLQASNQAVASTIGQTASGIGYIGLGYVTSSVKALTLNGVDCSKTTVLNNTYAYSRPLFMYTNGKPQGEIKKFIGWLLSADGQKLVEAQGFVPLK